MLDELDSAFHVCLIVFLELLVECLWKFEHERMGRKVCEVTFGKFCPIFMGHSSIFVSQYVKGV